MKSASAPKTAERRGAVRYPVAFAIALTTVKETLNGQAINASREGVLLEAEGQLRLWVTVNAKEYRGRLVRAEQDARGRVTYAIELEDPVEWPTA